MKGWHWVIIWTLVATLPCFGGLSWMYPAGVFVSGMSMYTMMRFTGMK